MRFLDGAGRRLGRAGERDADVSMTAASARARASAGGTAGGRECGQAPGGRLARSAHQIFAPDVAASGLPIADMKRCLMNTQSSGGFIGRRRLRDLGDDHPGAGLRA